MNVEIGPIGIIGAGRLGSSLAVALHAAGYPARVIASRSTTSAEALANQLEGATAATPEQAIEACEMLFLTVPDDEIASLAASLPWREGQHAVHCSGAIGLDALAAATEAGATAGCLHPLQSFPSREGDATRFRDIVSGIEAPAPLSGLLEAITRDLGGEVVRLEGVDRARYHAAAVFASNYAVALASAAGRAWELAGLPAKQARLALAPLLLGTATNIADRELAEALTGPLARGDLATIERHLAVLDAAPDGDAELAALYRRLGSELLALDLDHPPMTTERLHELFEGD
ncbi:MAG TPA: DUF2520 domain-containing protein [Dehalococcoidia bacterium]|jgi:predicted short-subunit dehydrogenase-like oxidoreductase (DUF2520 family)|nr:DUF2520 domain-containing protein [Dehalococcoidia bacterium]